MQFFIITPFIIFAYLKKKALGISIVVGLMILSAVSQIIVFYSFNLGGSMFNATTNSNYGDQYYIRPYCRINPYLCGIIFAWMYMSYKDPRFKFPIWDKINTLLKNNPFVRYTNYIVGLAIINMSLFFQAPFMITPVDTNMSDILAYTILSRPGFVIGLMMIIHPVTLGKSKPLLTVLGNEVFTSMARISYGAYLLHLTLFGVEFADNQQAYSVTIFGMTTSAISIFIVVYLVSFFFSIFYESPFIQIMKIYLFPVPTPSILPKTIEKDPINMSEFSKKLKESEAQE